MDQVVPCPGCGGTTLYRSNDVSAGGSHGPDFLPGLGRFFRPAKFVLVVCRDCGLTRFYAQPDARAELRESKKWKLV
jgi:predicted nucleic-acid-binding Zn-ribbon protein